MNNPYKKLLTNVIAITILYLLCVPCSISFAGDFACFDAANTIPNRVIRKVKSQGASYSARNDCVRITRNEYDTITNRYTVVGNDVVSMTIGENNLLNSIISINNANTESTRISLFDSTISTVNAGKYTLPKIDQKIDNISSLDEAKIFLKQIMRYLIDD